MADFLTTPIPPDVRDHLVAALARLGADTAGAQIESLIRSGVVTIPEGRAILLAAFIGLRAAAPVLQ